MPQGGFDASTTDLDPFGRWRGQTVAIKYCGAAMGRAGLPASFAGDVTRLRAAGVHPVILHGGGARSTPSCGVSGKTSRFVDGLRVTDDETMELVEMVLVGRIAGGRMRGEEGRT